MSTDDPARSVLLVRARPWSWARRYRQRQHLRSSLWALPLLGGVVGILLAVVDGHVEQRVQLPPYWQYDSNSASGLLSAVIAAMVGLFGFVVTISVLVVQMATGTLSPRFMRLWYRDRLQKVVLAMFVATIAFSFRLLHDVDDAKVPNVGVNLAGAMFGTSLILLLLYLDRFAHKLRPVGVGAMVGQLGLREAEKTTHIAVRSGLSVTPTDTPATPGSARVSVALSHGGGAIQAVNVRGLVAEAVRTDAVIVLTCTIGDFVAVGTPVLEVHGSGPMPQASRLISMIAFGTERSIEDDPAFALRIMVDIAIRALSPAVNDPTTAVQLLNQIEALLRRLLPHLSTARFIIIADARGQPRLILPVRSFADYLQLAVTEIRRYGAGSIQVSRRMTAMLIDLSERCPAEFRPLVAAELATLDRDIAARITEADDRALARIPDRQGIGAPRLPEPAPD